MTQFTIKEESNPTPVIMMTPNNSIMFYSGGNEVLRVSEDGFYVRGKRVPADQNEAEAVYRAFKAFLVWHGLTKD
jgi:hypothetical protein